MIASVSSTALEYFGGFSGFSRSRELLIAGPDLKTPSAGDIHQFRAFLAPFHAQFFQHACE